MEHLFVVTKGNEFGSECLSDAYVSVAIENAFIKFNEYAENPDIFGCGLYEYDPVNQKFNLIESHYDG